MLTKLFRQTHGQSMIESALVLSLIALLVVGTLSLFGIALAEKYIDFKDLVLSVF